MPSGVITGEKKALGRAGRRPSWFVLSGASGGEARPAKLRRVMVNKFAFGGINTSVILQQV